MIKKACFRPAFPLRYLCNQLKPMNITENISFLRSVGLITKTDIDFQLSHIHKGFNPLGFYNTCEVYITDGVNFYEVNKATVITDYKDFAYFYKA